MRQQNYPELSVKQILILSYINRYHYINYSELQNELKMPFSEISFIVMRLFSCGYIKYSADVKNRKAIYVNECINGKLFDSWDKWTFDYRKEVKQINVFNEKILYIPQKFDKL